MADAVFFFFSAILRLIVSSFGNTCVIRWAGLRSPLFFFFWFIFFSLLQSTAIRWILALRNGRHFVFLFFFHLRQLFFYFIFRVRSACIEFVPTSLTQRMGSLVSQHLLSRGVFERIRAKCEFCMTNSAGNQRNETHSFQAQFFKESIATNDLIHRRVPTTENSPIFLLHVLDDGPKFVRTHTKQIKSRKYSWLVHENPSSLMQCMERSGGSVTGNGYRQTDFLTILTFLIFILFQKWFFCSKPRPDSQLSIQFGAFRQTEAAQFESQRMQNGI